MKPPPINLEQVTTLPMLMRLTVPEDYQDENGHMNMRYYLAIFDDAGYPFVDSLGLGLEMRAATQSGGFDLEHHIHYLREVHPGDSVAVYLRVVGRTAKRMHYLMFLVNESRGTLAAIFECINAFADLSIRRTAPWPAEAAARLDALVKAHAELDWAAPVCGVMNA
jgi:acyl-CoA thioester hydrolase